MPDLEYTNCAICKEDHEEFLFTARENLFGMGDPFRVVKCRKCGLVYINPRPKSANIGKYYPPELYYSYQEADSKSIKERIKAIIRRSLPGYDKKSGFLIKVSGSFLRFLFSSQIDVFVPYVENGTILDVGCGNGDLIGWMKEYGWRTFGVEIGKNACEHAGKKGINVYCGQLKEASYPSSFFDVIIMNHVIEHVFDPAEVLMECGRILKPKGLLIVDCPNFECYDSKLFGNNWASLAVPTHLYQYPKGTLEGLLAFSGFEVKESKYKLVPHFIPFKSIKNVFNDKESTKTKRFRTIVNVFFLRFIKYIFCGQRGQEFSPNITVYAIRKI